MGKSSLINRLRLLKDSSKFTIEQDTVSPAPAPVSEKETTIFPIKYTDPKSPSIIFVDFPGHSKIGYTKGNSKIETYYNNYINNCKCDMYVIVYVQRLNYEDIELAKKIRENRPNSPIFLIRNHAESDYDKKKTENPKLSDKQIYDLMKIDLKAELNDIAFKDMFSERFKKSDLEKRHFFISAKIDNFEQFQFGEFKNALNNSMPDEFDDSNTDPNNYYNKLSGSLSKINPKDKDEKFLKNAKEKISEIRKDLEKRIKKLAILSALTDIVPIGGTIADIAILIGEITRYRNEFGLKKEALIAFGEKLGIPLDNLVNIAEIVGLDSKYIHIKNLVFTFIGAVSIGLQVAMNITQAVSIGINIATFGIGCLVSAAISGPISFILCDKVLTKALDDMENDSMKIIELVYKELKQIHSQDQQTTLKKKD